MTANWRIRPKPTLPASSVLPGLARDRRDRDDGIGHVHGPELQHLAASQRRAQRAADTGARDRHVLRAELLLEVVLRRERRRERQRAAAARCRSRTCPRRHRCCRAPAAGARAPPPARARRCRLLELRGIVQREARARVVEPDRHAHEPFETEHAGDVVEAFDAAQEAVDVGDDVALPAELDAVDRRCSRRSALVGSGPARPRRAPQPSARVSTFAPPASSSMRNGPRPSSITCTNKMPAERLERRPRPTRGPAGT